MEDWVTFVPDRNFNDKRYDIRSTKLQALGWKEQVKFEEGLNDTIKWYTQYALPSGFWSNIKKTIGICSTANFPRVESQL